jgi:hypothetical protein
VCDYCYNSLAGPKEEKKEPESIVKQAVSEQKTSPRDVSLAHLTPSNACPPSAAAAAGGGVACCHCGCITRPFPLQQVEYLALYDFMAESEREVRTQPWLWAFGRVVVVQVSPSLPPLGSAQLNLKAGERLWVVEEEMDGWFEAKAFDGRYLLLLVFGRLLSFVAVAWRTSKRKKRARGAEVPN